MLTASGSLAWAALPYGCICCPLVAMGRSGGHPAAAWGCLSPILLAGWGLLLHPHLRAGSGMCSTSYLPVLERLERHFLGWGGDNVSRPQLFASGRVLRDSRHSPRGPAAWCSRAGILEPHRPVHQPWPCHRLVVCPRTNCLTSVSLSLSIHILGNGISNTR